MLLRERDDRVAVLVAHLLLAAEHCRRRRGQASARAPVEGPSEVDDGDAQMLSRMTWMTSMARGSLFWKGTVTNVLKNEKLPASTCTDRQLEVARRREQERTDPMARAGCSAGASRGPRGGCGRATEVRWADSRRRGRSESEQDALDDRRAGEGPATSAAQRVARFGVERRARLDEVRLVENCMRESASQRASPRTTTNDEKKGTHRHGTTRRRTDP